MLKCPESLRLGCCSALMVFAVLSPGWAQEQTAAARALYDEGSSLMNAGRVAEACPKFEASLKIEPRLGTRFQLATCYERSGRTATAWAAFADLASQAAKEGRQTQAQTVQARADALVPRLSKLLVRVAPSTAGLPGLRVERDRLEVPAGMFGVAVPVDPGPHTLEATAPGRRTWSQAVDVSKEGAVIEVSVPELPSAEVTKPESVPPAVAGAPAVVAAPRTSATPRAGGIPRWIGWTSLGVGVVGLGLGSALLVGANSSWNRAKDDCDGANHCGESGLSLRKEAISQGDLATVFFVVGAVGAAAGGVLLLTARPTSAPTEVSLHVGPAAVVVAGKF